MKARKNGDNGLRFLVLGIRHFENGEHHWLAPEDMEEAKAFGESGSVTELPDYRKPIFSSMKDAENYATSLAHGECTLAQWECRRPTWYVVEEWVYVDMMDKERYSYPREAEAWSDAKVADFERECDCEDIACLAVWNSDDDEERTSEKTLAIVYRLNLLTGLDAWLDAESGGDVIAIAVGGQNKECVADYIECVEGFPKDSLEWVKSDESVNTAWYRVK